MSRAFYADPTEVNGKVLLTSMKTGSNPVSPVRFFTYEISLSIKLIISHLSPYAIDVLSTVSSKNIRVHLFKVLKEKAHVGTKNISFV